MSSAPPNLFTLREHSPDVISPSCSMASQNQRQLDGLGHVREREDGGCQRLRPDLRPVRRPGQRRYEERYGNPVLGLNTRAGIAWVVGGRVRRTSTLCQHFLSRRRLATGPMRLQHTPLVHSSPIAQVRAAPRAVTHVRDTRVPFRLSLSLPGCASTGGAQPSPFLLVSSRRAGGAALVGFRMPSRDSQRGGGCSLGDGSGVEVRPPRSVWLL